MPSHITRETFFRPDSSVAREPSALPADLFNGLQLLLSRGGGESVFLPIRSMQYLAVITRDETLFVDAQGGYAHQDGVGGRIIRIAWRPARHRESLSAPVPCDIVYYFEHLTEVQRRLISDIRPSLKMVLDRQRERAMRAVEGRILPFRQP